MERKKRRTFTPEYKAEIVRVVRTSGKSPELIAKEYELTPSAVRAWVDRAVIDPAGAWPAWARRRSQERGSVDGSPEAGGAPTTAMANNDELEAQGAYRA